MNAEWNISLTSRGGGGADSTNVYLDLKFSPIGEALCNIWALKVGQKMTVLFE